MAINTDYQNESIIYEWNSLINRDGGAHGRTENNNTIIKSTPSFMADIQKINKTLNSAENIKKFICKTLNIDYKKDYARFGLYELAVCDATPIKETDDAIELKAYPKAYDMVQNILLNLENAIKENSLLTHEMVFNQLNTVTFKRENFSPMEKHLTIKNTVAQYLKYFPKPVNAKTSKPLAILTF